MHSGGQGKSLQSSFSPIFKTFFFHFIPLVSFKCGKGEETTDWHLWSQRDLSSDSAGLGLISLWMFAIVRDEKAQEKEIS